MSTTAPHRPGPFITRVRIEDYRSIAHCDVALGRITVLLGLNAAGKSNFLDALRFVRDALVSGPAEAVAARAGWDEVLRRMPEPTASSMTGRRTAVVPANREFEAWFLASAPSLGGRARLAERLEDLPDSEALRDCKGWLTHHRRDGVRYRPRVDQAALTQFMNLGLARAYSSSFDKFCRDITYLVTGKRGE
ncbi:AAA family ATPase [Streptomyces sp. NPDC003036]|uniref:AAA family ATPase n=1 Tax=Streptomyces sp. NPDC003036 TaxID=3154442 RepID=UPI0033A51823